MTFRSGRPLAPALTVLAALLAGCSSEGSQVLDDGDAEWERPPLTPPGGDGEKPEDSGYPEDGGGLTGTGDPGGTAGDSGDEPPGTTGGPELPYTCEPADTGGVCDAQAGVCEPAPEVPVDTGTGTDTDTGADTDASSSGGPVDPGVPAPCCEDPDCGCDTSDCAVQPCGADAFCDCNCPADPDCGEGVCMAASEQLPLTPAPDPAAATSCPGKTDPVVLYMSNDDSNSQASPVLARRAIVEGGVVDPFRVRIHEFLNYYDLQYADAGDAPAKVGVQMRRIDADAGEFALLLYAQGQTQTREDRRPINLVFSLDTSGSMEGERMDLLKATMKATAGSLRDGDIVSVVTWNSEQSVVLDSHMVAGADDPTLVAAIDALQAGGSTDLHAGLVTAYELADKHFAQDRINRVMLISDGGANTGETDDMIIGEAAGDEDGEGIYLIGVGVGGAFGYEDRLMDTVTDRGKGAYVFIDRPAEAQRAFGERFLQQVEVAARDVQMQVTLPYYFGVKEFHGEEYSADPAEVEPQHLAPNDAMSYHQTIQSCEPRLVMATDKIKARVTYEHPISREKMSDEVEVAIGDVVDADATQLHKADVIVAYAQALIVIGDRWSAQDTAGALQTANDMTAWLATAAADLNDPDITEIHDLMQTYAAQLKQQQMP